MLSFAGIGVESVDGDEMVVVEGESEASVVTVTASAVVPTAADEPAGAPRPSSGAPAAAD